ncbi:MAG TPA: isoleucine--tRNA ligase [Xanthobacteraceae bacterium]|nr:isoleucine--tRNA ligase [Xanthobacteraceae bacterium]
MTDARDYSATLFLPQTDFPMRAGLPQKEPELLERWRRLDIYHRLRRAAAGRARFILHDGPPYANGNIHIGTALNKILKDVVTRSQQMLGFDSNYVPGWDCHGLPIEWKVEEEYRAQGRTKGWSKDEGGRGHNQQAVSIIEFRRECRAFADHWIDVQREEFVRLGVEGDWAGRYATMDYPSEAQIARELMKFAANGTLYRGSKPVMWSVVEQTALAEAEVEYEDYISDQIWVKFPVAKVEAKFDPQASRKDIEARQQLLKDLRQSAVLIWTTTPWTIPGNRAISFSFDVTYGLYEVIEAPTDNWARVGDRYLIAVNLADEVFRHLRVLGFKKLHEFAFDDGPMTLYVTCHHPLRRVGAYDFDVPLLPGDHVTDKDGTGFVHTAPGHGTEDFEVWMERQRWLTDRNINPAIPYTVDADGRFTDQAPGFTGKRVLTETGEKGDANEAVIQALIQAGMLVGRGRLKHQYPHSWRSKKPVIFRNTPQWFIAMDQDIARRGDTLRHRALVAIGETRWVPPQGENRITGMIESRPDWVISRQRAWGVPITVFVRERGDGSVEILKDERVNARIAEAFEREGSDAWFKPGAAERFLKPDYDPAEWSKVDDILDVWFESGSTHAFTLEVRPDLKARRKRDGGPDTVMYLEGSDQHRGWFQSSLLESCGTRGFAPFDIVLTHGFALDEHGRKMSKSLGNTVAPQDVIDSSGADILRLWACASDYADDLRIGPEILKTSVETYRKLRNTIRWMLGNLAHFSERDRVAPAAMPQLERLMLHRLAELDALVREAYAAFDYKRIFAALNAFMTADLSAFYFDVRKDALYCDPASSLTRKACLTVLDHLFRGTVLWLAPMLCFTAEEAWLARYPSAESVHLEVFPEVPAAWRDDKLAEKWRKVRLVRRVVTGALEIERAAKRIGSSLEAAPVIHVADPDLLAALAGVDMAEVAITSAASVVEGQGPPDAFRLDEVPGVAVEPRRAEGRKCARSWKILPTVGADPDYPDVSPRDAQALREWDAMRHAAQ